jgi:hypothetical protein
MISPVPLNDGERKFVVDLQKFYERNKESYSQKKIYLLRNLSKK